MRTSIKGDATIVIRATPEGVSRCRTAVLLPAIFLQSGRPVSEQWFFAPEAARSDSRSLEESKLPVHLQGERAFLCKQFGIMDTKLVEGILSAQF